MFTRDNLVDSLVGNLRHSLAQWSHIDWVESIDSTNTRLLEHGRQSLVHTDWPRLLGAQYQTQGRGRAGRPWLNQPGQTLMFSCGFLVEQSPRILTGLAPALGLVTCAALRALAGPDAQRLKMKWPNDIMLDDAKLAGILVESKIRASQTLIVIGMGLNLRQGQAFGQALNRNVGDWHSLSAPVNDVATLVAKVAQTWSDTLQNFDLDGLPALISELAPLDYLFDRPVDVLQNGQVQMSGVACGIHTDARLRIRTADGQIHKIIVGDISVRPDM